MTELHYLTIAEAGRQIAAKTLSPVELVEACLRRIEAVDGRLSAFITVTGEQAMDAAREAEAEIAAGRHKGPLHGIPIGLKDIYATAGVRTTCHSRLLFDNVPGEDAVTVAKLKQAGAIMIGKLATHEFAFGGPSFDLPFPPARNPWHLDYIPGGSSSGSGAAVAAGLCAGAMGSDTGGSIRSPAGVNGIVGLKPTYGRLSRRGVYPLSFSLDHAGPMTWTVEDCALMMQALSGHDAEDPGSVDVAVPDFTAGLGPDLKGMRIGVARSWYEGQASDEVVKLLDATFDTMAGLGATLVDVELPDIQAFHAAGRIILLCEAYAIHKKHVQDTPEMYGQFFLDRMRLGAFIDASKYVGAQRLRRSLNQQMTAAMADVDVVVTANQWGPAETFEQSSVPFPFFGKPYLTMPFNCTGQPALTISAGMSSTGLPIGFQIAGRLFDEPTVLKVAHAYETARGGLDRRPPI